MNLSPKELLAYEGKAVSPAAAVEVEASSSSSITSVFPPRVSRLLIHHFLYLLSFTLSNRAHLWVLHIQENKVSCGVKWILTLAQVWWRHINGYVRASFYWFVLLLLTHCFKIDMGNSRKQSTIIFWSCLYIYFGESVYCGDDQTTVSGLHQHHFQLRREDQTCGQSNRHECCCI